MRSLEVQDSSMFKPARRMLLQPSGTHLAIELVTHFGNVSYINLDRSQMLKIRDYLNEQLNEIPTNANNSTNNR